MSSVIMTSKDLRDVTASLLDEKLLLTQQLQEILCQERIALEKQDTDAIESTAAAKSRLTDQLQAKDDARMQLCASQGLKPGVGQMHQLIESCDEDGAIQGVWQELMTLASDCRSLNMTNGAIIRQRQEHFASSIAVLSGTELNRNTYGSHGEAAASAESRAIATA